MTPPPPVSLPDAEPGAPAAHPAGVGDYLRLLRIPNVFTALADVGMGFLFVRGGFEPLGQLFGLLAASSCLYLAGMVLNDVYDAALDAAERPERPIPSGRISLARARRLGYGLLLGGLAAGWLAGFLGADRDLDSWPWRSGVTASALAACVVLYDRGLKRTPLGPLGMGACRFLNVLLGMTAGWPLDGHAWTLGFGPQHLVAAGGIGVYIVGVTWFARDEAGESRRGQLALATLVMVGGIVLLGTLHRQLLDARVALPLRMNEMMWFVLLGLLTVTILRRCGTAIMDPDPWSVQAAVRHAIWTLIFLDAAVVLLVRDLYALAILALLIPTMLLGRWYAAT
jgi:4-hydroxybenzoate polyprenyltransferase